MGRLLRALEPRGKGGGQCVKCFGNNYLNFISYLKSQAQINASVSLCLWMPVLLNKSLSTYLIAEKQNYSVCVCVCSLKSKGEINLNVYDF